MERLFCRIFQTFFLYQPYYIIAWDWHFEMAKVFFEMKAKKVFIYDVALIKTPLEINKSFNKEKESRVLSVLTKRKN